MRVLCKTLHPTFKVKVDEYIKKNPAGIKFMSDEQRYEIYMDVLSAMWDLNDLNDLPEEIKTPQYIEVEYEAKEVIGNSPIILWKGTDTPIKEIPEILDFKVVKTANEIKDSIFLFKNYIKTFSRKEKVQAVRILVEELVDEDNLELLQDIDSFIKKVESSHLNNGEGSSPLF